MNKMFPMFFIVMCSTVMLICIIGGFVLGIFANLVAVILNIYLWVEIDKRENPRDYEQNDNW